MMAVSIRFILLATVIVALSATSLVTANKNHGRKRIRRQGIRQLAYTQQGMGICSNACQNRGHSTECCDLTQSSCFNSFCGCYCDISCHLYDDCCDDIESIGCSVLSDDAGSCPMLELGNGTIVYSPNLNSQEVGNIAYLSCNEGYALVPSTSSIRVCQSNQEWSNLEAVCVETCEPLSDSNGRITYEPATNTPVIRTVATYTCNEGYAPGGSSTRVCEENGQWSGHSKTQCKAILCQLAYPSTNGCASVSDPLLGIKANSLCSCSATCFINGLNCCDDIGCIPQNCADAGVSPGCCEWDTLHEYKGACFIRNETRNCYCDQSCKQYNDCCHDVPQELTCPSSSSEAQSRNRDQSVRVRLMSQAQSSRPPMMNQASRDLASELKSMTRAQAEKRQRWEVIAKELENMQHKKT